MRRSQRLQEKRLATMGPRRSQSLLDTSKRRPATCAAEKTPALQQKRDSSCHSRRGTPLQLLTSLMTNPDAPHMCTVVACELHIVKADPAVVFKWHYEDLAQFVTTANALVAGAPGAPRTPGWLRVRPLA